MGAESDRRPPWVSIIIPLHRDNPAFRDCLAGCLTLEGIDHEILVVTDNVVSLPPEVQLVLTRSDRDTGPGEKRDIGMRHARGAFLAFVDDDARPRADWLSAAIPSFDDPSVGAVAGPGLTPADSSWREQAGGAFYESWLGSGPYRYRFRAGRKRMVDDYPAYNLIVRRSAADEVRGWGTTFYGGEDTVICLALVGAGWKILYDPGVVVYHRRRPILRSHLAQLANVGRHRGYFVKAYPDTSFRPAYFLPTAGVVALSVLAAAAVVGHRGRRILAGCLAAYSAAGIGVGILEGNRPSVAVALPGVALASHVTYGVQFIRGLFTRHLSR